MRSISLNGSAATPPPSADPLGGSMQAAEAGCVRAGVGAGVAELAWPGSGGLWRPPAPVAASWVSPLVMPSKRPGPGAAAGVAALHVTGWRLDASMHARDACNGSVSSSSAGTSTGPSSVYTSPAASPAGVASDAASVSRLGRGREGESPPPAPSPLLLHQAGCSVQQHGRRRLHVAPPTQGQAAAASPGPRVDSPADSCSSIQSQRSHPHLEQQADNYSPSGYGHGRTNPPSVNSEASLEF